MNAVTVRTGLVTMALSGVLALAAGCGQAGNTGDQSKGDGKEKPAVADAKGGKKDHDHSGWWCDEHGIPEHECSMCSGKVFKEMKAKGDICEKHPDRAKSQCFICDPSLKEKYAAKYRAKYGKEPPEPEGQKEETGENGDKK